jgi:cytochrome c
MRLKVILLAATMTSGIGAATAQEDAAAGAAVFKTQCSICHSVVEGKNLVGPSLFGVVGRHAGDISGFHYSEANKNSGLTWDAATLDRYLKDPQAVVPKTIMPYPGLKDDTKRANLIAYLSTLH